MIFSIPSIPTASAGGSLIGDKMASIQWVKASIPAPAVRTGGNPNVSSGSQIAAFGIKCGLAKINFLPSFIMIKDPTDTSLPVPEVVGIAIMGIVSFIFPYPPSFTA